MVTPFSVRTAELKDLKKLAWSHMASGTQAWTSPLPTAVPAHGGVPDGFAMHDFPPGDGVALCLCGPLR